MATHSISLAWKIPWMEETGRLQSIWSLRVKHDWVTSLSFSLSRIGEGNGNPLQYTCLENPTDGEAWWAVVYKVAQSLTRQQRLSCSSSMDLTFKVPMQYCSLQHWTLLPSLVISINWVLFLLWLHLFSLSGVISPLISGNTLGTHRPGKFISQCPIFLPIHTVHWVLKARVVKWFAFPFCSGPHFVRTSLWPIPFRWPYRAWLLVSLSQTKLCSTW